MAFRVCGGSRQRKLTDQGDSNNCNSGDGKGCVILERLRERTKRRRDTKEPKAAGRYKKPNNMHTDTTMSEIEMPPVFEQQHRFLRVTRRLDEVEYWRQQAGWVDDAADLSAYKQETTTQHAGSVFGSTPDEIAKNVLKLLSIVVALGLSILFFRAIMRRMSSDKERKRTEKSRSGSSSRRSRSRSRSRKGEYDLMKDGDDGDEKSKRSSRSRSSRSRSRRSRSRSRTERSRSKSRVDKPTEPVQEAVLV